MANHLIWPNIVRPRSALVYLDLNHYINLAKAARSGKGDVRHYVALRDAATRARREERAIFPLSETHLFELTRIKDPAQRLSIVAAMEELSDFHYLPGRVLMAELEMEAGLSKLWGYPSLRTPQPLVGQGFQFAFAVAVSKAKMSLAGLDDGRAMGSLIDRLLNRAMLAGPPDSIVPELRDRGYDPEVAHKSQASSLGFELQLSEMLKAEPRWRLGRLRDLVSGREIVHEWLDILNRLLDHSATLGLALEATDEELLQVLSALPHVQTAISLKTAYHRNPQHPWTVNDIADIDAASVAVPYCDVFFADKAIRAKITSSRELRQFSTYLPRTAGELAQWLDALPSPPKPEIWLPVSWGP